jgi:predicted nucleic acid-binding protein
VILYLDTSALVPLVIEEPSSTACAELWEAADHLVGTRLVYVEARAALAMAERLGRISARQFRSAADSVDRLWRALDVLELDSTLMTSAALLSRKHSLRGYDAVNCAAALAVSDTELVAASGDSRLLGAWRRAGVATADTGQIASD